MKVIGVILVLLALAIASFVITSAITKPSPQAPVTTSSTVTKPVTPEEATPSTLGRTFVFFVLVGILVWIIYTTYTNERGPETGPTQWKKVLSQPVFIAIAGVVILNSLSNLFIYPKWRWFWDHQTLFWGVNMALVIFVHFQVKKETYAKFVAGGIGLLIFLGFVTTIHAEHKGDGGTGGGSIISRTTIDNLSYGVPADIALRIIADCESGGGEPGKAHQFEADGKTPLKNKEGSSAIGKYQILASDHEERAKKMGFDIGTEAGNEAYAKVLFSESGTKHWEADPRSKACWQPKLASLGLGQGSVILAVEAPAGKLSDEVTIPSGIYFDWGDSIDSFEVLDQKGSTAKYDPSSGVRENLPYPSRTLWFRSLGEERAIAKLKLSKTPMAKM
jgi:hypothetical protein